MLDGLYFQGRVDEALEQFDKILESHPVSPRAVYGRSRALNALAEKKRSNAVLEKAIAACIQLTFLPDVPKQLLITAGKFCAERQSFRG